MIRGIPPWNNLCVSHLVLWNELAPDLRSVNSRSAPEHLTISAGQELSLALLCLTSPSSRCQPQLPSTEGFLLVCFQTRSVIGGKMQFLMLGQSVSVRGQVLAAGHPRSLLCFCLPLQPTTQQLACQREQAALREFQQEARHRLL